jgi:hypothetical protein
LIDFIWIVNENLSYAFESSGTFFCIQFELRSAMRYPWTVEEGQICDSEGLQFQVRLQEAYSMALAKEYFKS